MTYSIELPRASQLIRKQLIATYRVLRIDFSFLSAGYFTFFLQMLLYCTVDSALLLALNGAHSSLDSTLLFERLALIFLFTGVVATVTQEFNREYTDSIQLLFGTWLKRYLVRAFSIWISGSIAFDALLIIASLTSRGSIFHAMISWYGVIGFDCAIFLFALLGSFLGAFFKSSFLAKLLPALVLVTEASLGTFTKSKSSRWSLSGLFLPYLQVHTYAQMIVALVATVSLAVGICLLALRVRPIVEEKINFSRAEKIRPTKPSSEGISWRIARWIEARNHNLGVRFAQLFTNVAFLRLPWLFLWLGAVPLFSNKLLSLGISEKILLPIIGASIAQNIIMISLIAPSILENKAFIDNEVILFKSQKVFRSISRLLWQLVFSMWNLFLMLIALIILDLHDGGVHVHSALRAIMVVVLVTPMFVYIASLILLLPVDPRFFSIFAIGYYIITASILGSIHGVSRFLPTELVANLAGGRGLYQTVLGESAVSTANIAGGAGVIAFIYIAAKTVQRRLQSVATSKSASLTQSP